MVAVHSAAAKRACGYDDMAACPQIRAWHHDHHLCRSRAGGRKPMRGLEVNPDARKRRAGPHVPGPGTACAGAGPDLTPAAARELARVPVAACAIPGAGGRTSPAFASRG